MPSFIFVHFFKVCVIFVNKNNLNTLTFFPAEKDIKYKKQNIGLSSDFSRAELNTKKRVEILSEFRRIK